MKHDMEKITEALIIFTRYETAAISRKIKNIPRLSNEFYTRLDKEAAQVKHSLEKSISLKKAISILIAAALIIASLSIGAYAISEREKIGSFFVEWFDGHADLNTDLNLRDTVSVQNVRISYIPEGYLPTDTDTGTNWAVYKWESENADISISISPIQSGNISLNTENSNYMCITVGDYTVHRNMYVDSIFAFWDDTYMTYSLNCTNLSWDEMVKIIEGISYTEE